MPPPIQGLKNYLFQHQPGSKHPIAVILPPEQTAVLGAVVKLDGSSSWDPEGKALTFSWVIKKTPIGSQVVALSAVSSDLSIVSFVPDVTGQYEIELTVDNGQLSSNPREAEVLVRLIDVPYNQDYVPDASFIWDYLSDAWSRVENRERIETFWSAMIQSLAGEQIKLYEADFNKSIRDIQSLSQRRWLPLPTELALDATRTRLILADDQAGLSAETALLDPVTSAPLVSQPDTTSGILVPVSEGSLTKTPSGVAPAAGRVLRFGGRSFSLLRTTTAFRSLLTGQGSSLVGTKNFTGAGFQASMVGQVLKILEGVDAGSYQITAVTGPGQITVQRPQNFAGSTIAYTVLPSLPSHSLFVTDLEVPGQMVGRPWRFGATLRSLDLDFELQGVSPGDVLEAEIVRQDVSLATRLQGTITAVDRSRLSFVLHTRALVDGVAAGGLSDQDQIRMVEELRVKGLSVDKNGLLAYGDDALEVKETLSGLAFRRAYYDRELPASEEIDVGPFSITIRPIKILRRSKLPVPEETVSIPFLQERVRQPEIVAEAGQLYHSSEGRLFPIPRLPYVLMENLDYVTDAGFRGVCTLVAGVSEITVPFGDLIDRSLEEGDLLDVFSGVTTLTFTVKKLLGPEKVLVYPTPAVSGQELPFIVRHRVSGTFVRLAPGRVSSLPERLWADVTFLDNTPAVERNFGVLVGLSPETLANQGAQTTYKSAVQGLLYALTRGPSVRNLTLAAQILLGLPFARQAGVVTEINQVYKARSDGSPLYGRVLVAGRDSKGQATGQTDIYLFHHGRQVQDPTTGAWLPTSPDLSGLANNPATGKVYQLGDSVSQFALLSKGVLVIDHLTDPTWHLERVRQNETSAYITRFHRFTLLINSDVTKTADIDLVGQYIRETKPAYVKIETTSEKELEDPLAVSDQLVFERDWEPFDNPWASLPTAVKFDYKTAAPDDFTTVEGQMYGLYKVGSDLVTVAGQDSASSPAGGFVTIGAGLPYDSPFLRTGDLLVIYDQPLNQGRYTIGNVSNDTTLASIKKLDGTPASFAQVNGQYFAVYRPVSPLLHKSQVSVTQGSATVSLVGGGGLSAGIAPGDAFIFGPAQPSGGRYEVVSVTGGPLGLLTLDRPVTEATAQYTGWFVRESLLTRHGIYKPTEFPFELTITQNATAAQITGTADSPLLSLLRTGCSIHLSGSPVVFTGIDYDPVDRLLRVIPPAPADFNNTAFRIEYPGRSLTVIAADMLDRALSDAIEVTVERTAGIASTVQNSTFVTLIPVAGEDPPTMGIVPGDLFVLLEGTSSATDIGYGPGAFPIHDVQVGAVKLVRPLSATENELRFGYRRRKLT